MTNLISQNETSNSISRTNLMITTHWCCTSGSMCLPYRNVPLRAA